MDNLKNKDLEQVSGGASITEDAEEQILERKGRNASIAEAKAPVFKAGKAFKDTVK